MEYLERSVAIEPQATALELMGQIRLKKGEAKEAVALFEQAIAAAQERAQGEQLYWRAKLRRELGDAYEAAGDAGGAEHARKAALADWDALVRIGLDARGARRAGHRARQAAITSSAIAIESLADFESAIDAAPDRGGTYADVIAFLVPRGELDEALDAYHRALGRNEVTDYSEGLLLAVDRRSGAPRQAADRSAGGVVPARRRTAASGTTIWRAGRRAARPSSSCSRASTRRRKKAESAFYRAMRAIEAGDGDSAPSGCGRRWSTPT